MIKNYFKTAWRNLVKHKGFSFINIFGLSAGIGFELLTGAVIYSEMNVSAVRFRLPFRLFAGIFIV